ncbi:hypothetical protein KI387_015532 [Taxus chinensis]|uniref:Neprosin PEP catalytic domain-containing protein n=1 Tax=Taxus chinensis TaxID=29808 RepID=A0AA38GG49_TAXCH|nr:hypothetical protein KI387_015532 [Taxus chinensis]
MQSGKMLYICAFKIFLLTLLPIQCAFSDENMSVDDFVNYVNPPAVHRYKEEDGGAILCVRFEDQLSLRSPTSYTSGRRGSSKHNGKGSGGNHSRSCPPEMLAFREVSKEDVLRAGGVARYTRKPYPATINPLSEHDSIPSHKYAVVEFTFNAPVVGTSAKHSVWKPRVAKDAYYSLSQVWVSEENRLETVEAGWLVDPQRHGDDKPRFFTYWTADRYQTTGCYNANCPGFVVLMNNFGELSSTKSNERSQYELTITIILTERDGEPVWDLHAFGTVVGYWPCNLFRFISQSSSLIVYGGEVSYKSKRTGEVLSNTEMGSGHFPSGDQWMANANIRQIQFSRGSGAENFKVDKYLMASNTKCYDVVVKQDHGFGGLHIFYGGPGGGAQDCQA